MRSSVPPTVDRRPLVVCLIGIDGAGKTTLAKSLVASLRSDGLDFLYVYGGLRSKLMRPIKLFTSKVLLRHEDPFRSFAGYAERKRTLSARYVHLARLYAAAYWLDFGLQTLWRVSLPVACGHHVVLDRYVYDAALNLELNARSLREPPFRSINRVLRFLPRPDLLFLLDVQEEVALARKNDTPDIVHLTERRSLYRQMIQHYGGQMIDGSAARANQMELIRREIAKRLDLLPVRSGR